jgi:hypothetical protein
VTQYGEAEYWDHRYQSEPVFFDWYLSYEGLEPVLQQHVSKDASILQVRAQAASVEGDQHCNQCDQHSYRPSAAAAHETSTSSPALQDKTLQHTLTVTLGLLGVLPLSPLQIDASTSIQPLVDNCSQ